MSRFLLGATLAVVLLAPAPASAFWIRPRVAVAYYYPAPVVPAYYAAPAVTYVAPAPVVTSYYYAPAAPVVTSYYYQPVPYRAYYVAPPRVYRYWP